MPTKKKRNQPETPNEVQFKDFFQTPRAAIDLLLPFIPKNIEYIYEPACGEGRISEYLKEKGYKVISSDIDPKYDDANVQNFLNEYFVYMKSDRTMIITNPPYSLKKKFYKKCLECQVTFALLIQTDYCGWIIDAIRHDKAEKIIPNRRINYISPFMLKRINDRYPDCNFTKISDIPVELLIEDIEGNKVKGIKGNKSQFHSMWFTHGLNLGRTETFVELTKEMMNNV